MDMIDRLKMLLARASAKPAQTELIYILLPQDLDPFERHVRFADPIDVELRLAGLGYVSGGGSLSRADDEDGSQEAEFCGVDVEATDVPAARDLLRRLLPALECPTGTQLHYREAGEPLQDEYDGTDWVIGRPPERLHPAFGL